MNLKLSSMCVSMSIHKSCKADNLQYLCMLQRTQSQNSDCGQAAAHDTGARKGLPLASRKLVSDPCQFGDLHFLSMYEESAGDTAASRPPIRLSSQTAHGL